MRKRILIIALLFVCVVIQSQSLADGHSDSFQEIIDNAVSKYSLKGVAASVILPDNSQWTGKSGIASEGVPIDTSKLFLFASLTKTFAAATILQLAEEGALALSDPVGEYISTGEHLDDSEPIKDLLNMSTAYADFTDHPDFWTTMALYPDSVFNVDQVLETYVTEAGSNEDDRLIYRNTNFLLIGLIVESVTGNTFEEELQERFFNPLGLNNTYLAPIGISEEDGNGGWGDIGNGFQYIGYRSPNSILTAFGAAGGLVSTPQEMSRWIKALHEGDFLSKSSLDSMRTLLNGTKYANGYYLGQGLGTQASQFDEYALYGHKGNLTHHSLTLYSLDKEVAISFVVNHKSHAALDVTTHELFKQAIKEIDTRIAEYQQNAQLVYPNPAKSHLTADLSEFEPERAVNISIVDYLGRIVMQSVSSGNDAIISLEIDHILPGNYILLLQQEGRLNSAKFVIE